MARAALYYLVVRQGPMRGRVMSCRRFAGLRREAAVAAEELERRLNGGVTAAEAERAALARATQGGHMAGLVKVVARLRFVSVLTPTMAAQLPGVRNNPSKAPPRTTSNRERSLSPKDPLLKLASFAVAGPAGRIKAADIDRLLYRDRMAPVPRSRPAPFKTASDVLHDLAKRQGDRRLRIVRR